MSEENKRKYPTTFNQAYSEEYPCIIHSKKGSSFAACNVCNTDFSISHHGKGDIVKHINTQKHKDKARIIGDNKKIDFMKQIDNHAVIRAEALFTSFLVEHNLPINSADHVGPLFRKMFPDSQIAKKYGCARTKTMCVIGEMAKTQKQSVVEMMKNNVFSIATDGSHKNEYKLYPVVVTIHNDGILQNETLLLSVDVLQGDSTGLNIAQLILNVLGDNGIPFENCLALGADNAPVMIGKKNGVAGILTTKIPHLYVIGCACHLLNLAAEKGAACLPVNVEEYVIDIFYYLEKSSKRKEKLKKFQMLHDVEIRKILKHVSTRWLSLGRCLQRLLQQWDPLTSLFKEEAKNDILPKNLNDYKIPKLKEQNIQPEMKLQASQNDTTAKRRQLDCVSLPVRKGKKQKIDCNNYKSDILSREERLFMYLSSTLNKAFAYFLMYSLPLFEEPNVMLQTDSPNIHRLRKLLLDTFKNTLARFVTTAVIKASSLLDVKYHDESNQKINSDLVIGQSATKIVESLNEKDKAIFFKSVRKYFVTICDYMLHKFPFQNEVLIHSEVADIENIDKASFSSIKFFIEKFPGFLKLFNFTDSDSLLDILGPQFCEFQLEELPEYIKSEERMDVKWAKANKLKNKKYEYLCKLMLGILTIPHSNAACERIFSLVTKTHTQFRSSLCPKNMESLLTVKSAMKMPCFEQNFDADFLKRAKSSTIHSK